MIYQNSELNTRCFFLEATTGLEPVIVVLQTTALSSLATSPLKFL